MENIPLRTKRVIKVSKKTAIVFAVIVVLGLAFLLLNKNNYRNNYTYTTDVATQMESGKSGSGVSLPTSPAAYYPNQYENSSVKDTREFMKVSYGTEIKTRDVKEVMRDVKSAIGDANGRIDNISETKKYAYVNFVIPKSNLSDFKDEIESITNEKLYTENSSSQNLLNQKQSIEEQKETATNSLSLLQKNQKDLTAKHTQAVNNLQKEITSIRNQLVAVRKNISATSDSNTLASLRNQEYSLSQQEISLQQSLNSENSNYTASNQSLKNQIANVNAQLKDIDKQDTNFTDNVETVDGYISVNWTSLWDMAEILSPIHPTIIIIIIILLGWYYLSRKNYLPGIEFV